MLKSVKNIKQFSNIFNISPTPANESFTDSILLWRSSLSVFISLRILAAFDWVAIAVVGLGGYGGIAALVWIGCRCWFCICTLIDDGDGIRTGCDTVVMVGA